MKWLKEGAHEWVYGQEGLRMLNWILKQQLEMTQRGQIPSFENFQKTYEWSMIQKYLSLEQQFIFRCTWIQNYKIAWQDELTPV